jgi:hypothetical protein
LTDLPIIDYLLHMDPFEATGLVSGLLCVLLLIARTSGTGRSAFFIIDRIRRRVLPRTAVCRTAAADVHRHERLRVVLLGVCEAFCPGTGTSLPVTNITS